MYYSMSRLSILDVKWTELFDVNTNPTFFNRHSNPYNELIVVADGLVNLEVKGERIVLQTGDSLLLQPWEQHSGWNLNERRGKFFWTQFSCHPGMDIFSLSQLTELGIVHAERTELRTIEVSHEDQIVIPRIHKNQQCYRLLNRFEELVETMKQPHGNFRLESTLLLADMLKIIANDFLEQKNFDTTAPLSYITFRKLVNYLNNGYNTDISREKLGLELDYNYNYLCNLFHKYTGISMNQYIQQLRVQRAKHLLQHTGKSIQQIANEVGYTDSFYFSRIFKKITGTAPLHFRDSLRQ